MPEMPAATAGGRMVMVMMVMVVLPVMELG